MVPCVEQIRPGGLCSFDARRGVRLAECGRADNILRVGDVAEQLAEGAYLQGWREGVALFGHLFSRAQDVVLAMSCRNFCPATLGFWALSAALPGGRSIIGRMPESLMPSSSLQGLVSRFIR